MKANKTSLLLILAGLLAQSASANLVTNGNFTNVSLGTGQSGTGLTTLFGQFGSMSGTNYLNVAGWSTSGYNFVFAPGTADSGTNAAGANSGQPNEAPGQYNTGAGYGSTYLSGPNNGYSSSTLPSNNTAIGGGNFIAADGAYETGAISQTITGLIVGRTYALKFYWGGAQQEGAAYNQATTEYWTASLGNDSKSTSTTNTPLHGFSGWFQQTFYFNASSTTETLSFLAGGTPTGQPPFALLGNVDLSIVPDYTNWMVYGGFGAACVVFEAMRRQRRRVAMAAV